MAVTLQDVQAAHHRIRDFIYCSPAPHSDQLSEMTGQHVFLKLDNLQRTGAFKERGALNKILSLSDNRETAGRHRRQRWKSCPGRGLSCDPARHPFAHRHAINDSAGEGVRHNELRRGSCVARHQLR